MSAANEALLVLTNLPDRDAALKLASALVDERVAACVNVLGACTSIYHWQGKVENTEETPVVIKTVASRYAALETAIKRLHPYELPEIVAVPITRGLPAYLQWVTDETRAS